MAVPSVSFEPTPIVVAGKSPARLMIEIPNDAKLFVDGVEVPGTGTSRLFHTPELLAGQDFYYDLKAEVVVNGKPVVEETRVVVKAGERSTAKFEKLVAAAAPQEVATK